MLNMMYDMVSKIKKSQDSLLMDLSRQKFHEGMVFLACHFIPGVLT